MVGLFILLGFNSSIVAERGFSRPPGSLNDFITLKKEMTDFKDEYDAAKEEFDVLDDDVIQKCLDSQDYNELLQFMGEEDNKGDFVVERNVHVNASGSGLYLVKRMKIVKISHPLPRLVYLGILPPGIVNLWLFYIKFDETYPEIKLNRTTYKYEETGKYLNASTLIEYEDGSPSKYINGSHTILALVIQIMPLNKLINTLDILDRWVKGWKDLRNVPENDSVFKVYWPWSIGKYKFKNYWNFINPLPAIISIYELLTMVMYWPFNVWTSFISLKYGSAIRGMAPFVIWNNSTAAS
jgi:hypothetical protein